MQAIIFGGGKIARGFIAHLLYLNQVKTAFVDVNESLVALLNERQQHHVHIMGAEERSVDITDYQAFSLSDAAGIGQYWVDSDIAFTSVGGKNLKELARAIADAFVVRCNASPFDRPFNIITCENWKDPADELNKEILSCLSSEHAELFRRWVGISEAVVMRSAVEPDQEMVQKDPLCVKVQNYWELPVDRDRMKGEPPTIQGINYIHQFAGFLQRKLFTNNTSNAALSYIGYLKGHVLVSQAANDPEIEQWLDVIYSETDKALSLEHHIDLSEQVDFSRKAKLKYQDVATVDFVERHARDPIRKLGPDDRLIGAAKLVMRQGIMPYGIATAIAAALYYDHPEDPIAGQLRTYREQNGIDGVLNQICKLSSDDELAGLVKQRVTYLQEKGWLR